MALTAGEQATGGEVRDNDGRLIVVGPGGVAIGGGGGGTASTVALDAATLAALETISVANLLNPHPVSIATALDISDRTARLLGHVTVDNFPAIQPVSGSVNVGNFPASQAVTGTFFQATQPVSGTVTANAGTGPWPVTDNGGSLTVDGTVAVSNFPATQPVSGTVTTKHSGTAGAQTSVAATTTANTTLIAADAARVGLNIFNESASATLFVLIGAGTESATVYTTQVPPNWNYEVPDAFVTLRASGHWSAATGSARITAVT